MTLTVQLLESPCVTWKIMLPHVGKSCDSPVFTLKKSELHFNLSCCWSPYSKQESWEVRLNSSIPLEEICFVYFIEKKNGELRCLGCREPSISNDTTCITVFEFTRAKLTTSEILEDEVSITFVFHYRTCSKSNIKDAGSATPTNSKSFTVGKPSIQPSCLQTLSGDIGKLFDKEEHSDVVLKCGDRSFFANKRILSARSEVFAAMFRNKMSENNTGVVDIEDMETDLLEQFLRYVYSGRLDSLTMDSVCDLYRAGDKYAMPSLKRKCASFMVDNLSEKNVCQALSLADTFGDAELSDLAENFAVSREGFLKSDEWNDFAKAHPVAAVGAYKKFVMK